MKQFPLPMPSVPSIGPTTGPPHLLCECKTSPKPKRTSGYQPTTSENCNASTQSTTTVADHLCLGVNSYLDNTTRYASCTMHFLVYTSTYLSAVLHLNDDGSVLSVSLLRPHLTSFTLDHVQNLIICRVHNLPKTSSLSSTRPNRSAVLAECLLPVQSFSAYSVLLPSQHVSKSATPFSKVSVGYITSLLPLRQSTSPTTVRASRMLRFVF